MKDAAVFDIPCVFDSIEEVRNKVDDAKFYGLMEDVYKDAGYKLLGYADQGFRVMSTNKNVTSLSDFKGQKIRTMENPYHMAFWKSLKANPTPMTSVRCTSGFSRERSMHRKTHMRLLFPVDYMNSRIM